MEPNQVSGHMITTYNKKTYQDWCYIFLRVMVIMAAIFLFIPSLNPARITDVMNKNLSLFTSGVAYDQLTSGFGKIFRKEWLSETTMKWLMASSLLCCTGIIVSCVGNCATLGNKRLKQIGTKVVMIGSLLMIVGLGGIFGCYRGMLAAPKPDKLDAMLPNSFFLIAIVAGALLIGSVLLILTEQKVELKEKLDMEPRFQLFLMALPFISLIILFGYLPLLGWRYAFFDYKAGDTLSMDQFQGLKWFTYLLQNESTRNDIIRVMKNTLGMSGLGIATSWCSMAFAILLSELRSTKYRRVIQTFTTIPNFISWVLIFAVANSIFSADGFLSSLLVNIGVWESGRNLLMNDDHVWLQMLLWGMWKGLGWGAIVYIAAIAGIDQELFDAAKVDGAGRFQRIWHITVPALMPTYCVLLLLSVGNILSNGMDQYLVFENSSNSSMIQVLDLYVYQLGIAKGLIPLTTAIGMLKSVISIILVFVANKISKWVRGENII